MLPPHSALKRDMIHTLLPETTAVVFPARGLFQGFLPASFRSMRMYMRMFLIPKPLPRSLPLQLLTLWETLKRTALLQLELQFQNAGVKPELQLTAGM